MGRERETYSKRDIIEQDVEPRSSPRQLVPHKPRHILTLRNQLRSIELRNYALQHFIDNRREHPLVEVRPERAVYLRQGIDSRPR